MKRPGLALMLATLASGLGVLPCAAQAAPAPRSGPPITGGTTKVRPKPELRLPPTQNKPPAGYRLTARQAIAIADAVPKVRDVLPHHPHTSSVAYLKGVRRWQVSYFSKTREIAQVTLSDISGRVIEAWTGFQVAWSMARGYPGAFARKSAALYVWLPLCVLFLAPFVDPRRPFRWLHLDLLVLLSLSISLAFFSHGLIGISVPLAYPVLGYLLARMLVLARRRQAPPEPLRLLVPASWLAVALVFLIGFRVGMNVTDSNVIDVGYAGVIGANKLAHGKDVYGTFPPNNPHGDTYGPVTYLGYVPFERAFGWSGRWDDLPAAHAAAIAFDLLTMLGLWLLGRRVRGPTLGIALAYAWVTFPFTLYVLNSNANDSLVALLVVLAFLGLSSAPARGALAALAGLAKFAPLALAPLLVRAAGRWRARSVLLFGLAFAATALVVGLPVLFQGDLSTFVHRTLGFQGSRGSPFSVWGLYHLPHGTQLAAQIAAAVLAVAVAFVPRERSVVQVAALGAGVLIALQLGVTHWFYLYVVWWFPLVMLVLLGRYGEPGRPDAFAAGGTRDGRNLPALN